MNHPWSSHINPPISPFLKIARASELSIAAATAQAEAAMTRKDMDRLAGTVVEMRRSRDDALAALHATHASAASSAASASASSASSTASAKTTGSSSGERRASVDEASGSAREASLELALVEASARVRRPEALIPPSLQVATIVLAFSRSLDPPSLFVSLRFLGGRWLVIVTPS